jgi:tetratricopeptide (TPR) repeat protein
MLNNINISSKEQNLIIYIVLAVVTLAVFWQVNQFDFVFDDRAYITGNSHIKSGFTLDGFRWTFTTKYLGLWNPLVWLSFMVDYQLYGLNAGGYHLTNRILHILSALLLFWLFNRMTGEIWKSAFVAALFALHPLHVESVVWIAERKDVLSAFFWMLTLCLYVYYTEKPFMKRYLFVFFSFVCALMSKPMVVTLPLVMILLDYWPLKRFELKKDKLFLWQFKEKIPFFVLSVIIVIIMFYSPNEQETYIKGFPLSSRLANAPVAFVTYLEKTFWPLDLAVLYPFPAQIHIWQVFVASLLIIIISIAVIVMVKRLPYLFVGWLWFATTILPVIGIIQISISAPYAMADRYHYLPSIGIAVMLAWGIPTLIKSEEIRKKILFPMGIAFLTILSVLTCQQCGYWKNNFELFNHAVLVTKDNYVAHNNVGLTLAEEGKTNGAIYHYNKAINIKPDYADAYYNRGIIYDKRGQYQLAIEDYNQAIRLQPNFARAYNNSGAASFKLGQNSRAIDDFNKAIQLKQDFADAYHNRGVVYAKLGQYQLAIEDYNKAIRLRLDYISAYYNRGTAYNKLGQNQRAAADWNQASGLSRKKSVD